MTGLPFRRRSAGLALLAAAALILVLFHSWSLTTYPPPNADEAMEANHSHTLLTTGENVYSLFDDVFPRDFPALAHAFPNVLRPFYNASLALAFRLGGVSLETGRLLSLACSGLTVLLGCWLAWRSARSWWMALGVLCLLGTSPIFTASSHDLRPEAMLGLLGMAAFSCLVLAGPGPGRGAKWGLRMPGAAWTALAGLLAVASVGVHTNGAGMALAAAAACALTAPRRLLHLILGGVLAGTALLWTVRPDRFLPGWVLFQGFFGYMPPYRTWDWSVLGMLAGELTRWIAPPSMGHEPMTWLASWSLTLEWSLALGVWLTGWRVVKDQGFRLLLAWIGAMAVFHAGFFANKNPQYLSVFEPFLCLMLLDFLRRSWLGEGERFAPVDASLGAAAAAVLALAGPFLLGPAMIVLGHPSSDAKKRWLAWLGVLLALLPMLCLRVYVPGVLSRTAALGLSVFSSPLVWLLLCLPLAGLGLKALRPSSAQQPLPGLALAASLVVLALCQGTELVRRWRGGPRFGPVQAELRALVPAGAKTLGPQRLWLALWDRPYRDWNALAYSRWLTGDRDVRRLVARWEPDYLVADEDFRRMFVRDGRLAGFSDVPLERVGVVSHGPAFKQPIEVLRFVRTPAPAERPRRDKGPRAKPGP
ncbi:MAG: hypothetical protein HY924_11115 [Elusimicrobia bacterium]|nr:hypothetical protein [Elusimicrobiota bacterium]